MGGDHRQQHLRQRQNRTRYLNRIGGKMLPHSVCRNRLCTRILERKLMDRAGSDTQPNCQNRKHHHRMPPCGLPHLARLEHAHHHLSL